MAHSDLSLLIRTVFNPLPSVFAGHNDWIPMDRLWKDNDFCLAWTLFCSLSLSPSKSSHSGKNILPCCKPLCGEAHKARNWYLWPTASEDLRHANLCTLGSTLGSVQPVYTSETSQLGWTWKWILSHLSLQLTIYSSCQYFAACKTPWFKG